MIDYGRWTNCGNITSYIASQGVTNIAYAITTHYDADHIGCLDDLVNAGVQIGVACLDRGGSRDTATFDDYAAACGNKRSTATKGQVISLDGVTITVVDLNGAGVSTSDENALGVVLKVTYGAFDHEFGGDLTDEIEAVVGPVIGDVEVSKVHHHGSNTSTSDAWLNATTPDVGIVSVGGNPYGHPTANVMGRIHAHGVKTYWTNQGAGAAPDPTWDRVGGSIVIETAGQSYTVSGSGFADVFSSD